MAACHSLPRVLRASFSPTLLTAAVALLSATLLLTGCSDAQSQGGPGAGGGAPTVGVVTVQRGPVSLQTELPGRLEAWRTAQVRARISGIVQKRVFTEGADVKAGQSLYQLEDGTFQAALASAQSQAARAEAGLAQAQAQYKRNEPLVAAKAISQAEWVSTQAALKQAEADVAAGQAAVKSARINLDYAAVRAPIAGRVGRSAVTEGALVGPSDATPLTTIQQINTLYVNFNQSAADALRLQKAVAEGRLQKGGEQAAKVDVVLEDGSVYPMPGKLLFSDQSVDPATGQILMRAELPNPKLQLLPGLFVRVRINQARVNDAIRLPQQSVSRSANGDTVTVVSADGKVSPRPVKVIGSQGNDWIIESGLQPGEQVVVDGFQKLMMARGVPVKTVPWQPGGQGAQGQGRPGAPAGAASAPAAASAAASGAR
jgi:membrane fusion protein (multidrug efflux system)